MANDTRSSRGSKDDESDNVRKKPASIKELSTSGSGKMDTSGLRRSTREMPLQKQISSSPSRRSSSEHIDGPMPTTTSMKRKSEIVEKQRLPSPSRTSDRGKERLSLGCSGSLNSEKGSGSLDDRRKKLKSEENVKQLMPDARETSRGEKQHLHTVGFKKNWDGRTFKSLIKQKRRRDTEPDFNEELKRPEIKIDSSYCGGSVSKPVDDGEDGAENRTSHVDAATPPSSKCKRDNIAGTQVPCSERLRGQRFGNSPEVGTHEVGKIQDMVVNNSADPTSPRPRLKERPGDEGEVETHEVGKIRNRVVNNSADPTSPRPRPKECPGDEGGKRKKYLERPGDEGEVETHEVGKISDNVVNNSADPTSPRPRLKEHPGDEGEVETHEVGKRSDNVVSNSADPTSPRPRRQERHGDEGEVETHEVGKISDNVVNNSADPTSPRPRLKEHPGDEGGDSSVPVDKISRFLPRSTDSITHTLHTSHASASTLQSKVTSLLPEVHMVKSEEGTGLSDVQKTLHVLLSPEISKLCEILQLSEDVKVMVRRFLEYVVDKHQVNKEPLTILQAFQISVCWIAASLREFEIDKKASLALAKQHLNFGCTEEEANNVHSKLRLLKKRFKVAVQDFASDQPISIGQVSNCEKKEKELLKSAKRIQKKFAKQMMKLNLKQEEKIQELNKMWEDESAQFEKQHKLALALIRTIHSSNSVRSEKMKRTEEEHVKKLKEHEHHKGILLEKLKAEHLAEMNELKQKKERVLQDVKSWAQAEIPFELPSYEAEFGGSCNRRVHDGPENVSSSSRGIATPNRMQVRPSEMHDGVAEASGNQTNDEEALPECVDQHDVSATSGVEQLPSERPGASENEPEASESVDVPHQVEVVPVHSTYNVATSENVPENVSSPSRGIATPNRMQVRPSEMHDGDAEAIGNQTNDEEALPERVDQHDVSATSGVEQLPSERPGASENEPEASESVDVLHQVEVVPVHSTYNVATSETNNEEPFEEHVKQLQSTKSTGTHGDENARQNQDALQQVEILPSHLADSPVEHNQPDVSAASRDEQLRSEGWGPSQQFGNEPAQQFGTVWVPNQEVSLTQLGLHPPLEGFGTHLPSNSAPQMPSQQPNYGDPLLNELARLHKEKERTFKIYEETKLGLKFEFKKEIEEAIARIRRKYEDKFHSAESAFLLEKKELDSNARKVLMNKILADAFHSKCHALLRSQQGVPSNIMQQHIPSSRPAHGPSCVTSSASMPFVHHSSPPVSTTPAGPPLIVPITPPTGNLRASSEIRAPAPHLQRFRGVRPSSSMPSSSIPSVIPQEMLPVQNVQRNLPTASPSVPHVRTSSHSVPHFPMTSPLVPHAPSHHDWGRQAEVTGRTREVSLGDNNQPVAPPNLLRLRQDLGLNFGSPYLSQFGSRANEGGGGLVNVAGSGSASDVVCLSDED